jgi:hypothetical protein
MASPSTLLRALLVGSAMSFSFGCQQVVEPSEAIEPIKMKDEVVVEPRTQLIPTYPCSSCHAHRKANTTRRTLTLFHTQRNTHLSHGDTVKWCYQCHNEDNVEHLNLPNGKLVNLDEAYKLCVSCHGDKRPDWEEGMHGVTIGYWEGRKVRKSCTNCHDPHYPWYPTIVPERPPAPPRGAGPI